jgi:hypothetical protein
MTRALGVTHLVVWAWIDGARSHLFSLTSGTTPPVFTCTQRKVQMVAVAPDTAASDAYTCIGNRSAGPCKLHHFCKA